MRPTFLLLLLLALVVPVVAQRKHKNEEVTSAETRPASDARSFLELFGKLERDLSLATQKKDQASLDALVGSEFVERDAADPEHDITRTMWMKNLDARKLDPLGIRGMRIRAFLGNAVVSFVQRQAADHASDNGVSSFFIVDVWVTNHGKWQVGSRFISHVGSHK